MSDLIDAIKALDPNAWVGVSSNDINKIHWYDGNPKKLTKEQIQTKYDELVEKHKKLQYQRDRLKEYPDLQECIHAILDDDLTALQAKRKLIKEKYPKP